MFCFKCGSQLSPTDFGRSDTCSKCGASTRACKNCHFYDTSKYNECSEPISDRVVDKEKGNFCDLFRPSSRSSTGTQDPAKKAKELAEALFKKTK